ncbi:ABC transporter permease [Virgibacillus indicus]|uniref:ABC transporter permease n=1 Tax=Virgibacillus indicus TaxID=2024554 RepID=A0A265N4K9_9BACI|nr:sugar ABC transporter permease [Virgibacillus indicus]OZU86983.1 ABC transporter permease [Virgibacillus indicus]
MNIYDNKRAVWYVVPAIFILIIFIFLPIILNFYNSTFRWNAFSDNKVFVGLEYYKTLFTDPVFYTALKNNVLYAVISLVFQVLGGLILASILEEKFVRRFQPFFRTVLFIPSILSLAVVGLLWNMMYQPNIGVINEFIRAIGSEDFSFPFLGNPDTAIYAVIFVSQWQYTGYITMLFLVAMQKIPRTLYEAAMIDGANRYHTFVHITIPQVKEMILVATTFTVVGSFKVFDEVYIMTSGGPGHATEVLGTMLFNSGFRNDEMGYASAIATVIFFITIILSFLQLKVSKTGK